MVLPRTIVLGKRAILQVRLQSQKYPRAKTCVLATLAVGAVLLLSLMALGGTWFHMKLIWIERSRYDDSLFLGNTIVKRIYADGVVVDAQGKEHSVGTSAIDAMEGKTLYDLVLSHKKEGGLRTLEIGMAHGISSLYICLAHKEREAQGKGAGGKHVAIDPFQVSQWEGIGRNNLMASGLWDGLAELREGLSHVELPKAIAAGEKYDVIFIDGTHQFDVKLMDFFFSDLLLHVGGVLVMDDVSLPSGSKVHKFITRARVAQDQYRELSLSHLLSWSAYFRTGAFVKLTDDHTPWNFFADF